MKKIPLLVLALCLVAPMARAIPTSFFGNGNFIGPVIPATPRFNANLTREFLTDSLWESGGFSGPWKNEPALAGQNVKRMTANPVLFGAVPDSVYSYSESGKTRSLVITYLDAGTYFGFNLGGEKTHKERQNGSEKRSEFNHLFRKIEADLKKRLQAGCGNGRRVVIGKSDLLRTTFTDFICDDFIIRLAARDGHSVALYLMKKDQPVESFLDQGISSMDSEDRIRLLASHVATNDRGDTFIDGIPVFSQGNTPFCGIHSLAMVGHYYGLRIPAEGLEAGAQFKNTGSARGSRVLDLYKATAEEMDMNVSVSSKFDLKRISKAIEMGMPVIVWRRVSKEREMFHTKFAAQVQGKPLIALPSMNSAQRASWPAKGKKGSPSHASVISGINLERNEVIFCEPWGEFARGRRMSVEEMQATTYAAFYFKL